MRRKIENQDEGKSMKLLKDLETKGKCPSLIILETNYSVQNPPLVCILVNSTWTFWLSFPSCWTPTSLNLCCLPRSSLYSSPHRQIFLERSGFILVLVVSMWGTQLIKTRHHVGSLVPSSLIDRPCTKFASSSPVAAALVIYLLAPELIGTRPRPGSLFSPQPRLLGATKHSFLQAISIYY